MLKQNNPTVPRQVHIIRNPIHLSNKVAGCLFICNFLMVQSQIQLYT